ncbi:MAG: PAS domain-containing protein [Pseudomonadota bacterium]
MNDLAQSHIRAHWEDMRAGRKMPLRSEIDPREMSPYLSNSFILHQAKTGDVRFRVAGMAINELMGMELRAMPLRSIIVPEERARFSATLQHAFEEPEIQEYRLVADYDGKPRLTAQLLILPLKGDYPNSDRAMGCLTTEGPIGVPPRRFRVENVLRTSLNTGFMTRSTQSHHAEQALEAVGFSEAHAPFTRETKVPYLRVVK